MDHRSSDAIRAALLANLGVAVAKFAAFVVTRSTSMLAESIHSVADTANQGLLFLGRKAASRGPDDVHPFGYGRARYFWAFVVAMMLFSMGGVFSFAEGVEKLLSAEPLASTQWALAVLGVAVVLESWSLHTAVSRARPLRGELSWWQFIRRSKSPELLVVLLEDAGALVGLACALIGVGLATMTGDPRWDAAGSLAIGLLLIAIASVLAIETHSLILGEAVTARQRVAIVAAIQEGGMVGEVVELRTEHVGPEQILIAGRLTFTRDLAVSELTQAIEAATERIRRVLPNARWIYLQPTAVSEDRTASAAPG